RLLDLDVVENAVGVDALVVFVDGDCERLLGLFLPDHVLIEHHLDLTWGRDARHRHDGFALPLLGEDLVAERDTLVADVDRGVGNELLDRLLGLAAEAAAEMLVARHRPRLLVGNACARPDVPGAPTSLIERSFAESEAPASFSSWDRCA